MKMKNIFRLIFAAALAWAPTVGTAQATLEAERPVFTDMNFPQVALEEFTADSDGFYTIFDGTSTKGWRGYGREEMPETWIIEDGALKFDAKRKREVSRGDILFSRKFRDFVLDLDWKISENGNSGIFYMVREVEGLGTAASGLEAQVLDNQGHPDAAKGRDGNRMSSSLYDLIPAVPQNAKAPGEWNNVRIVVNDGHVEHWQNGEKVVEYELWTPEWKAMLADSKFGPERWPAAWWLMSEAGGEDRAGYIALQDHGDDVWFRNIRVKVLRD